MLINNSFYLVSKKYSLKIFSFIKKFSNLVKPKLKYNKEKKFF